MFAICQININVLMWNIIVMIMIIIKELTSIFIRFVFSLLLYVFCFAFFSFSVLLFSVSDHIYTNKFIYVYCTGICANSIESLEVYYLRERKY